MHVCLSSGYRPRYLRDIARALALPPATWLAFRYERGWIEQSLLQELASVEAQRRLQGEPVLIAYIDQHKDRVDFEIVPCRFATLDGVVSVGQTASLQLEVNDFAYAADLATFNDHLRQTVGEYLPRRVGDRQEGAYWFTVESLEGLERSTSDSVWEQIVAQLAPRPDFAEERFFYSVRSVNEIGCGNPVNAKENTFKLRPGRDYELRLYHYYPSEGNVEAEIRASATGAPLEFTVTPELLLDSRYDLKRLPFRTGSPIPSARGVLTLRRRKRGDERWEWDLDLGVRVGAAVVRQLLVGLTIAAALAATPIVAALSDTNLSRHTKALVVIVAAAASLVAGMAAAFGVPRGT
jgi:hypothetical protein